MAHATLLIEAAPNNAMLYARRATAHDRAGNLPAAPPVRFPGGSVHSIVVSPDGTRALASLEGRGLLALDLADLSATADRALEDLGTLAELAASHHLDEGDLAGLDADEWFTRWRDFRQRSPSYGDPATRRPYPTPTPPPLPPDELLRLADLNARRGEWKRAAAALTPLVELYPEDPWHSYRLAGLLALTGDLDAYVRHCRSMLEHCDTRTPMLAERVAKSCLLVPDAMDPEPAVGLIDRALEQAPSEGLLKWFHLAKGMAEYRQGRFENAAMYLKKSRAMNATEKAIYLEVTDLLFLAMAGQRLGKSEEARALFDHAREQLDWKLKDAGGDLGHDWHDLVMALVARREAEAMFRGGQK